MTWDEAKNFTWNDLSNFKWEDIELDKYEILAKAENGSVVLPPDIREQLLSLCTEIPELHEKKLLNQVWRPFPIFSQWYHCFWI